MCVCQLAYNALVCYVAISLCMHLYTLMHNAMSSGHQSIKHGHKTMSNPFSGLTYYNKSSQLLDSSGGLLDYMHPPLCHAINAEKSMWQC